MTGDFGEAQTVGWPNIDGQVVDTLSTEYVLHPEEFIVKAAQRLQSEQPSVFVQLKKHALVYDDPHASMKWTLLFYEALSRSAELSGTSLPNIAEDQLAQLHHEDIRLLSAIDVDVALARQAMQERGDRQYRSLRQFAGQYGEGSENLAALFMLHTTEAFEGRPSDDFAWFLLRIILKSRSSEQT